MKRKVKTIPKNIWRDFKLREQSFHEAQLAAYMSQYHEAVEAGNWEDMTHALTYASYHCRRVMIIRQELEDERRKRAVGDIASPKQDGG